MSCAMVGESIFIVVRASNRKIIPRVKGVCSFAGDVLPQDFRTMPVLVKGDKCPLHGYSFNVVQCYVLNISGT